MAGVLVDRPLNAERGDRGRGFLDEVKGLLKKMPNHYRRAIYPQASGFKKKPFPYLLLSSSIFCIWLIWSSLTPSLPELSKPPKLYANPSREDLRLTFLSAIRKSQKSIFLCMFGLNDAPILKAIADKTSLGMPVTVYYDAKGSPDIRKTLGKADIHPILLSGIMHQKILILDDETVFLGSANFTKQSLKMHDNLVIGLANQKIAQFLKTRVPHTNGYLRCLVGGQNIEIWLLPDPKGHALTDLKKKIRQCSRSLRIALFTLTHHVLIDEIIQAKRRGVDVTVVVDMHSALGASKDAVNTLQKAGVRTLLSQGVQLMHHKFAYIDERVLVMGSANWTKGAFEKNSDCLFVLHNLNQEQRSCMNKVWHNLETAANAPRLKVDS